MNEKAFVPPRLNRLLRALKVLRGIGVDCFSPLCDPTCCFHLRRRGEAWMFSFHPPMLCRWAESNVEFHARNTHKFEAGRRDFFLLRRRPAYAWERNFHTLKIPYFCTCVFRCTKYGTAATHTLHCYTLASDGVLARPRTPADCLSGDDARRGGEEGKILKPRKGRGRERWGHAGESSFFSPVRVIDNRINDFEPRRQRWCW